MFLLITAFLPDPSPDDWVKFKRVVPDHQQAALLDIMNWQSLEQAPCGEHEMTAEQRAQTVEIINAPEIAELSVFIGVRQ